MGKTYPLSVRNDRILPASYSGPAFVWDIDKTYLSTRFSSWIGLAKIPVEFAVDKQAIPGMPEILRGLRRGAQQKVACHPLYFISASPPFLRRVVEEKMLRDGVEQDGITFKDWLCTLLELRPDRLFDQLGFKTAALLRGRRDRVGAQEYLFGDDYESDAEAFSLYARWINRLIDLSEMEKVLVKGGVSSSDIEILLKTAEALPSRRGEVKKIYIHLEKKMVPENFKRFEPLLVAVKGAYQLALALRETGLIDATTVEAAKQAVEAIPKYRYGDTRALFEDAVKRGLIKKQKITTRRRGNHRT